MASARIFGLGIAQVHTSTQSPTNGDTATENSKLTSGPNRWLILRTQRQRLLPSGLNTSLPLQHPNCSSHCRLSHPHMPRTRRRRALPLSLQQPALSPCPPHPHCAYSTRDPPRLPGRHPALRPAHVMGRLDRARGYHPHHRLQRRNLCDAKNARQPESTQEADSGELRDERPELL